MPRLSYTADDQITWRRRGLCSEGYARTLLLQAVSPVLANLSADARVWRSDSAVLAEGPTSEVVVAALRDAIRLHGKPERVYTDRGAAFTAWRDVTSCEQFLDEQLIDHSLRKAHRPQGGGKIESVIGTVQRELWEVVHFDDVAEAERALAVFFADYNHRRAHLGIGSLVPADRFYGRWPEVVAEMDAVSRRRQGALALQLDRRLFVAPPAASERVIALQLILVGDQAELHFGGRRVVHTFWTTLGPLPETLVRLALDHAVRLRGTGRHVRVYLAILRTFVLARLQSPKPVEESP